VRSRPPCERTLLSALVNLKADQSRPSQQRFRDDDSPVSKRCRVLRSAFGDSPQIQPVRGSSTSGVCVDPGRSALQQPGSTDGVAAGSMRESDADLSQSLPQVPLTVGPRLPAGPRGPRGRRRVGPVVPASGPGPRPPRGQRVLGHRVDTGRPIGQGPTQRVPGPLLTCPTGSVAVPPASHAGSHGSAAKTRTTDTTTRIGVKRAVVPLPPHGPPGRSDVLSCRVEGGRLGDVGLEGLSRAARAPASGWALVRWVPGLLS
jgi:hypothetical protein